jgi:glycosyltransferase involved in cell wall biosynthesis
MSSAVRSTAAGPRRLAGQLRTLVWFPDDQVGWLPFAVLAIVRAHRRSPLAAVVSSSSPVTAHLAAGIARRLLGIAWIADFRDPWLDNPIEPRPGRLTQWRRRVVETWIVRSADRCTFATPSLAETYRRRYPRAAGRMDLVPNGYDRAELGTPAASRSRRKRRSAGPVRLVYAGSLYRPAELETFLLGVRRLMGRRDVSDRLRVDFVGTVTDASRAIADRQLVEEPGLEAIVAFHGFVPREEALRRIAEADAALTLLGAGPGMEMFVGAKLFDYIGLDRPILAVVPPGDAGRVLADLGWGIAADPTPEGVADGLSRLIDDPAAAAGRTGRADPEGRYDRRRTAALLGELLRCSVEGADPAWGSRSNAASDRP